MLKKMKDEVKEDIPFYVICTVAIIMCIFSLWRVFSPDFQKNSDDTEQTVMFLNIVMTNLFSYMLTLIQELII